MAEGSRFFSRHGRRGAAGRAKLAPKFADPEMPPPPSRCRGCAAPNKSLCVCDPAWDAFTRKVLREENIAASAVRRP